VKITLEVSTHTEATASPWWLIIDPKQNFETGNQGVHNICSMITGPFFSREEAEESLAQRRHHYSKNAVVFCDSGCYTKQYDRAYREAWVSQKAPTPAKEECSDCMGVLVNGKCTDDMCEQSHKGR
jgi:hypothetical protein